ncbi:MAG: hypothetical protein ACQEUT_07710 [Bacillota bacterium]
MKKVKGYKLPQKVLDAWKEKFIPNTEILFFREAPNYITSEKYLPETPKYFSLDEKTSFTTWSVSDDSGYYTKTSNETFLKLTESEQQMAMKEQWYLRRGMVFTEAEVIKLLKGVPHTKEVLKVLETASFVAEDREEKVYMLQHHLWNSLSPQVKTQLLLNYAKLWTDDEAAFENLNDSAQQKLNEEYHSLSAFFDSFPFKNGPNCLSAAAAAFTGDTKVIEEWMKPERFQSLLKLYGYKFSADGFHAKEDVLVWRDKKNQIVHACFLLNHRYCFNKHGQTMFNPWQVLPVKEVINSWMKDEFSLGVYKKAR